MGMEWVNRAAAAPRPDFIREKTMILDGEWDFDYDRINIGKIAGWKSKNNWTKKIRVPYCVESELSGINNKLPPAVVWYSLIFDAPDFSLNDNTVLLNFGAVDYKADVWLNGVFLGGHVGGYTPFKFDITPHLKQTDNRLVLRVKDSIDPRIPRGKQSFIGIPFAIFYTTVTGIWQSVYLETTGVSYIDAIKTETDPDSGEAAIRCDVKGKDGEYVLRCEITDPDGKVITSKNKFAVKGGVAHRIPLTFTVENPMLWSPDSPSLYSARIVIETKDRAQCDVVDSYLAFRKIEIDNGVIKLNGNSFYQKLLLKQGYFPEGHYTPGNWDMFKTDIEQAKEMGFNGVRMHIKIENPKFLFYADALGFVVWEEMPSAFLWSETMREGLRKQLQEAVDRDHAHPCIITWLLFCESWGVNNLVYSDAPKNFVREMVAMVKSLDPTRPVVDNSGFEHVETDILDIHHYLGSADKARSFYESIRDPENMNFNLMNVLKRFNPADEPVCPYAPGSQYMGEPVVISEYGGFGFYKTDDKPLIENFRDYTLDIAKMDFIQGYCYTQQYDTEQEQNGLLNFDRTPKTPIEDIRKVNDEVDRIVNERKQ